MCVHVADHKHYTKHRLPWTSRNWWFACIYTYTYVCTVCTLCLCTVRVYVFMFVCFHALQGVKYVKVKSFNVDPLLGPSCCRHLRLNTLFHFWPGKWESLHLRSCGVPRSSRTHFPRFLWKAELEAFKILQACNIFGTNVDSSFHSLFFLFVLQHIVAGFWSTVFMVVFHSFSPTA